MYHSALSLVVVGYFAATTLRLPNIGLEGKTEKLKHGDLALPINATGEVRPALRVEIKSEASGEVIEIAKKAGDRVRAGEKLIRLQKDDEQRSVDRARQDLQIAKARLDTAKIRLELAKGSELQSAQAQVDQLVPMVELAKFRKDKILKLDPVQTNDEEILKDKRISIDRWRGSMRRKRTLKRRSWRSRWRSSTWSRPRRATGREEHATTSKKATDQDGYHPPINGVVADARTQIGEVIQGGKTTRPADRAGDRARRSARAGRAEVDEADIGRIFVIRRRGRFRTRRDLQMPTDLEVASAAVVPARITVESFRDEEFRGDRAIYPVSKTLSGGDLPSMVITMRTATSFVGHVGRRSLHLRARRERRARPNEAIREGSKGKLGVYAPAEFTPGE